MTEEVVRQGLLFVGLFLTVMGGCSVGGCGKTPAKRTLQTTG